MRIEVYRLEGEARRLMRTVTTNADGRTDAPVIAKGELAPGVYELLFHAGAYLDATGVPREIPRFLDQIPIRFGIADLAAHYHVPLLLRPTATRPIAAARPSTCRSLGCVQFEASY